MIFTSIITLSLLIIPTASQQPESCKSQLKAPFKQPSPNSKFIIKEEFGWGDETKKELATIADLEAACVAEGFQLPGAAHLPDWLSIQDIGREYITWGMSKGYHTSLFQAFKNYNNGIILFIFGMGDRDENNRWVHTSGERDNFAVWDYKFGNPSDAYEQSLNLCLYFEEGKWFIVANDLPKTWLNDQFFPVFLCQFPYHSTCYNTSKEEEEYKEKYMKEEKELTPMDLPYDTTLQSEIDWSISNVCINRSEAIALCESDDSKLWEGDLSVFGANPERLENIGTLVMNHFRKLDIVPQAPFHTKSPHQMSYFQTPTDFKTQNTGHSSQGGAPTPLFAICYSKC